MNYERLEKIYKEFCEFQKKKYVKDSKTWFGTDHLKVSDKQREKIFDMYSRYTFVEFWSYVRRIIYAKKNVFEMIEKTDSESWDLASILTFLVRKRLVKVKKNGKVVLLDKNLRKYLMPILTKEEIERVLSKKLRVKLSSIRRKPVNIIPKMIAGKDFSYNANYDQMPISVDSAITVVEKIIDKYPFYDGFLFVGDDDFISIIMSIIVPKFSSIVIDIDENLLDYISKLAEKIKASIVTMKVDIRTGKKISSDIMGFLMNPPYTAKGVMFFTKYGVKQFGEKGGYAFIIFGDETIGKRKLFIQEFFTKNNLMYEEIVNGKIGYPSNELHEEDVKELKEIQELGVSSKVIKSSYQLASYLYILKYVPWKVKHIEPKGMEIYSYI